VSISDRIAKIFPARRLTGKIVSLALAIAMAADGLQWLLGPVGWLFADEIIDVITMFLISRLLGFHLLLLPTFIVEFIPVADLLPTWSGCVALLVVLRKREQVAFPPPPEIPAKTGEGN
jgi:hypothetical protein